MPRTNINDILKVEEEGREFKLDVDNINEENIKQRFKRVKRQYEISKQHKRPSPSLLNFIVENNYDLLNNNYDHLNYKNN